MIGFNDFIRQCKERGVMVSEVQRVLGCSASQVWQWQHDNRVFVDAGGKLVRVSVIRENVDLNELVK